MQIVTIIENNPITGVRYGTIEMPEYNNVKQRRIERYNRLRNKYNRMTCIPHNTKHK